MIGILTKAFHSSLNQGSFYILTLAPFPNFHLTLYVRTILEDTMLRQVNDGLLPSVTPIKSPYGKYLALKTRNDSSRI